MADNDLDRDVDLDFGSDLDLDLDSALDFDDQELTDLFAAFDKVTASDDLKASTLASVLDAIGEEAAEEDVPQVEGLPALLSLAEDETVQMPSVQEGPTQVVPVQDEAVQALSDVETTQVSPVAQIAQAAAATQGAASADDAASFAVVEGGGAAQRNRRRRSGLRMRVAAAIVAVVLMVSGTIAYALPVSHVRINAGESFVTLGVNVFGTTVSMDAEGEDVQSALSGIEVRNKGFEAAFGEVVDALGSGGISASTVDVQVESPLGDQASSLRKTSSVVLSEHGGAFTGGSGQMGGQGTGPAPQSQPGDDQGMAPTQPEEGQGGEGQSGGAQPGNQVAPSGDAGGSTAPQAQGGSSGGGSQGQATQPADNPSAQSESGGGSSSPQPSESQQPQEPAQQGADDASMDAQGAGEGGAPQSGGEGAGGDGGAGQGAQGPH